MGGLHVHPVVQVLLLVILVEGVVVTLVRVVLQVEVRLFVQVAMHLHVGISVSQLGVVVEGDSTEWMEVIWIHCLGLGHHSSVCDFLSGSSSSAVSVPDEIEGTSDKRVQSHVSSITESADGGKHI